MRLLRHIQLRQAALKRTRFRRIRLRRAPVWAAAVWAVATAGANPIPGPVTTVARHRGLPTLFVDGKPELGQAFETYVPLVRHFRQFREAGCRIYGFPCNAGAEPWEHSRPSWVGEDVWNFSELDEFAAMVLAADPDALLMPRIHVAEPDWWREANPADLMVLDDGTVRLAKPYRLWPAKKWRTYPSIASRKWREDMARSLRQMIDHIQAAPYADRIAGYHVYGLATEEWYHYTTGRSQLGDYSVHMQLAFRTWLRRKYWTVENLRAAWNDRSVTFATATISSRAARDAGAGGRTFRNPATEMPVIDFYRFYNEIVPEVIDYFAGVVKEACNRTKVVGAFYAYMFEFCGNPESGHLAVEKLLESDNVDFVVVTASYGQRQLGTGGSILRSPHTSLLLHDKLWYEDNDNVSFLFPEVSQRIGDAEWQRSKVVLAATDSAEETNWIYQRGAGFTLGNGVHQSFFDLHGGYFDHPEIMAGVKELYALFERATERNRTSVAEILVVADERSTLYPTRTSALLRHCLYDPPYRLIKCGAPYDAVYLHDLDLLDPAPYKLVVMLNVFHMTDEEAGLVRRRLAGGGRTILWVYAPGLFNGNRRMPERMASLTGMNLVISGDVAFVAPHFRVTQVENGPLAGVELTILGPNERACRLNYVEDTGATRLGVHPESGKTVCAMKGCGDWTSVYSITASLPPAFWRSLARSAGVHIYNDRDDTLYVSHDYLTVNADGPGERLLRFPEAVTVYDALTERPRARRTDRFAVNLRDKETRILRLERTVKSAEENR